MTQARRSVKRPAALGGPEAAPLRGANDSLKP
jgi:hypothetical protein